jgi:REP element-mobilizing transposase RayT
MANTYHQVYLQAVFAVKYRRAVIHNNWKPRLFQIIGNLIKENECKSILINGMEDHVHCLIGLKPKISISDLLQRVKAKSSKFINETSLTPSRFEWQSGYGVFSYRHADLDSLYAYIANQEAHHKTKTFREEYIELLKEFGVEFDEQYLFRELE